jgi:hypothetical protein
VITRKEGFQKAKSSQGSSLTKKIGWYHAFLSTSLLGIQPDQVSCSRESRRGNKENEGKGRKVEVKKKDGNEVQNRSWRRSEDQEGRKTKGYFCTPAFACSRRAQVFLRSSRRRRENKKNWL